MASSSNNNNKNNNTNGTANGHKNIEVNGETNGWDPNMSSLIIMELRRNGGLNRIQSTVRQRLDQAGWSEALREYIRHLFRSGEATTYDDALAIISRRIDLEGDNDQNDVPSGIPAPDLNLPQEAIEDGAEVVKKEIRAISKPAK